MAAEAPQTVLQHLAVLLGPAGALSNAKTQLSHLQEKMGELGFGIALQDVICTVSHSCVSILLLKKKNQSC